MASGIVPGVHHLVGVHEVASMLGLTRQRVNQLAASEDFPAPQIVLHGKRRIWLRADIERWAEDNERAIQ